MRTFSFACPLPQVILFAFPLRERGDVLSFALMQKKATKEKIKAASQGLLRKPFPLKGRNSLRSNSLPFFTRKRLPPLNAPAMRPKTPPPSPPQKGGERRKKDNGRIAGKVRRLPLENRTGLPFLASSLDKGEKRVGRKFQDLGNRVQGSGERPQGYWSDSHGAALGHRRRRVKRRRCQAQVRGDCPKRSEL